MTPTNKDNRGVNYWIQGARNWAMWQDFDHDAWAASHALSAWNDLPGRATEHLHALLSLALKEKRIRHEAEAARDDSAYYARRLADIDVQMSEIGTRIG